MQKLTSQQEDFPKWYQEIVEKAELAEHSPVRGAMTIRPYGYSLWENMVKVLDAMIKEAGVKNAYFPLFVPKSFIEKEADHVEGFAPEIAWVTKGGGKDLEEPLAVRPTSETVIGEAFSRWIQSYRDLPMKINQWANVVRWELRPRLFMRTTEFLWQEGHTAHSSKADAWDEAERALEMYKKFMHEYMAIYVTDGRKSESERFAGAEETLTVEALMKDGKALQLGTSHYLGQNFSKAFGIDYLNEKDERLLAHTTSWGISTRTIGGLIMAHGDDRGLIIPPRIAPIQVVIVPILGGEKVSQEFKLFIDKVEDELSDLRTYIDWDDQKSPGWKFSEWEMKGVPLRVEVGAKEVNSQVLTTVCRDGGKKESVQFSDIREFVDKILEDMHNNLLQLHKEFTLNNINQVSNYDEFKSVLGAKGGFISGAWCGGRGCEDKVKEDTSATIRVVPFEQKEIGNCVVCEKKGIKYVLWAKAY